MFRQFADQLGILLHGSLQSDAIHLPKGNHARLLHAGQRTDDPYGRSPRQVFQAIITSDIVTDKKPCPVVYQCALAGMGLTPIGSGWERSRLCRGV